MKVTKFIKTDINLIHLVSIIYSSETYILYILCLYVKLASINIEFFL